MEAFSQLISSISRKISLQKKKPSHFSFTVAEVYFSFFLSSSGKAFVFRQCIDGVKLICLTEGKKKKMFKINFNRICAHMAIKRVSLLSGNSTSHRGSSWATNDGRGNRESLRKEENKELLRHRTTARQEKLAGWFLEGSKKKKKKKVRRTVEEWTLSHSVPDSWQLTFMFSMRTHHQFWAFMFLSVLKSPSNDIAFETWDY